MIGKITTQLVVTGSERRSRPKAVQPGNREWTTVIQGINAAGWAIPPFLIFAGQYHLSAWYEEEDIPRDWAIVVSDNDWTTNELGVEWLKHFIKHTDGKVVGARRLLCAAPYTYTRGSARGSLGSQNVRELDAQSTLIHNRIQRRKTSSPALIVQAISQLKKGAEVIYTSSKGGWAADRA
jgi:hypothetical protein